MRCTWQVGRGIRCQRCKVGVLYPEAVSKVAFAATQLVVTVWPLCELLSGWHGRPHFSDLTSVCLAQVPTRGFETCKVCGSSPSSEAMLELEMRPDSAPHRYSTLGRIPKCFCTWRRSTVLGSHFLPVF